MKIFRFAVLLLLLTLASSGCASSARPQAVPHVPSVASLFENPVVANPATGAVVSPFTLSATATNCLLKPVVAMGYSLDTSSDTTVVDAQSVNTAVGATVGVHTLHVKSWGSGTSCVTNVAIDVLAEGATTSSDIQNLSTWILNHDAATSGTATGATGLVTSPSLSGSARQFESSYTKAAGEIYSVSYASDTVSSNFLYDGWVQIEAGSSIANLEIDSNQVTANGQTVIYGFQCDSVSKTWDYTLNKGTATVYVDGWLHSPATCDVETLTTNTWHHIQVSYSRDNAGNVTYHSVWLDGAEQQINATVPSSFALGWKVGVVQTQFQLDGIGASGSSNVYLDNLTISRW